MLDKENRDLLLNQLIRHEGTKRDGEGLHVSYRCTAGALTIGYGHNLDAWPVPDVDGASRLTETQARDLLQEDVAVVERQLAEGLPWVETLDAVRHAVLVNMVFNMGLSRLKGFKKALEMARQGNFERAAEEMLDSAWARQVKGRALELVAQMRSGKWGVTKNTRRT